MNDQNSNLVEVIEPRFNEELYGFNNIEQLPTSPHNINTSTPIFPRLEK